MELTRNSAPLMKKFPNKADWHHVQTGWRGKKNEKKREKKTHKARHVTVSPSSSSSSDSEGGCWAAPMTLPSRNGSFVGSTPWDAWRIFCSSCRRQQKEKNGRNRASFLLPASACLRCTTWVADRSAITDDCESGESVVPLTVSITPPQPSHLPHPRHQQK